MISDLQLQTDVPGSLTVATHIFGQHGLMQPVRDVAAYLDQRKAQPETEGEESLLITLPGTLQSEVRAMVKACKRVKELVADKWSVQAACKEVIGWEAFKKWRWNLNTFRQLFDKWRESKDWTVLVNRSKAPVSWRKVKSTLPPEFLAHVETKLGKFARDDGKRQAWLSITRHWQTGKDEHGTECPVPGYEEAWKKRDAANIPVGWSYDNLLREIKKRYRFNPATRALLHEGESAAREHLPQNLGSRDSLRFLEKITFDDVRMDWLVFNPATGEAEELWMLVARDEATALVLGFVMLPATVREDGKATHLGAQQMKELAGYLLQTYPLPPYPVHWIVERGTATLKEAVKMALGELFNNRIKVHYTSMIGDKSPVGYAEKRKGNSRGKASHEAHNRLFHTQASFLPGQTGANWGIRPADLDARVKECREIHKMALRLPVDKQGEVKYSLLTLKEARAQFSQICHEQNFRRDHALEGFDEIVVNEGGKLVQRMEMPVERAMKLISRVERWDRVSPDVIITFLAHNQRLEKIEVNGEIKYKEWTYRPPEGVEWGPYVGAKLLCYHNAEMPEFLHVTTGDGRVVGTWALRGRGSFLDQEALAQSMRYTHAARDAAKAVAADLTAPQREQLAAMRAHNAALEQFVVTSDVPEACGITDASPVANSLNSIAATKADIKVNPPTVEPEPDCTADLLAREGQ